jgi:hypothetical protein
LLDNIIFGQSLVSSSSFHQAMSESGFPPWPGGIWVFIALFVSAFIAAVASWRVNINRFSMHALYRNRLIRAFLGASNHNRKPNPFTGFDEDDNIRAYDLWVQQTSNNTWPKVGAPNWRPFHVVNVALNVISTQNLAWQERKAEPFIVSPLHSGGSCVGYRYSSLYGDSNGISLGTAIAISGAAASPNMGYHSSPTLTFLMALFNVRLGWWLGNPGPKGANTYQADGPKQAIVPLLYEMFGLTTEKWKYVYLSDGGHFENLGLYEMVRRRCRFIIVSDAGCDPTYAFDDLGNAVRKISLDLGVDIRFYGLTELRPRQAVGSAKTGDVPKAENPDQPFYAVGVIDYPTADGGGEQGIIVYVKAGYHRHRIFNVGVRNYANANPDFPHQTTGDQFFSESQFESYRSLGFEIMDDILARGAQLSADPSNPKFKDVVTALRDKAVRDGRP